MILAAAVFSAMVLRALLCGYTGSWFLPVVLADATRAAGPFVVLAVCEVALRRSRPARARTRAALLAAVAYALLFACFGWGWIEPHTSVARALGGSSSRLPVVLGAAGAVFGLAMAGLGYLRSRPPGQALPASLAWFLIVGPQLYSHFDQVEPGGRLSYLLLICAAALSLALPLVAVERRGGSRALGAVAAVAAVAAVLATVVVPTAATHAAGDRESLVLVLVDTLRADMLAPTGAAAATTMPELTRIARDGTRFSAAFAPSPWTLPSTVSLLTAENPHRHNSGRSRGDLAARGDSPVAFAGPLLRDRGYQVASFVNNPYLRPYYGLARGNLLFRDYHGDAGEGAALASAWIAGHRTLPFFAMLHLMDPHWPYEAKDGFGPPRRDCERCDSLFAVVYGRREELRSELRRRYRAEVAFTDFAIGRFYDELARDGVLDNAWFIVVADHGEEFWEHGNFMHGHSLFDELLRVPLVAVPPRARTAAPRGAVIDSQVLLEDVGATIFDIAGIGLAPRDPLLPAPLDGSSLLAALTGASGPPADRPAVSGYLKADGNLDYAVRAGGFKAIFHPGSGAAELYDLGADPGETRDLGDGGSRKMTAANLRRMESLRELPGRMGLDVASGTPPRAGADTPDAELRSRLRELGYIAP